MTMFGHLWGSKRCRLQMAGKAAHTSRTAGAMVQVHSPLPRIRVSLGCAQACECPQPPHCCLRLPKLPICPGSWVVSDPISQHTRSPPLERVGVPFLHLCSCQMSRILEISKPRSCIPPLHKARAACGQDPESMVSINIGKSNNAYHLSDSRCYP